jgi:adenosylcobalamin-dependent ribonucleoside-triphosphate reductase
MFDMLFNFRGFPAGRTLWMGDKNKTITQTANFNCSFKLLNSISAYSEIMYLLMVGAGAGFSVERQHVSKLPLFNKDFKVKHEHYYKWKSSSDNQDNTVIHLYNHENAYSPSTKRVDLTEEDLIRDENSFFGVNPEYDSAQIQVGDSRVGWNNALRAFLHLLTFPQITTIGIDYGLIRPKGSRLKTFGGRASGYEPLKQFFKKAEWIIKSCSGKLDTLAALDLATVIAEVVVVAGVRRSSLIAIGDCDDSSFINAKYKLFNYQPGITCSGQHLSDDEVRAIAIEFAGYVSEDDIRAGDDEHGGVLPTLVSKFDIWDTNDSLNVAIGALVDRIDPQFRYRASRVMSNNSIALRERLSREQISSYLKLVQDNGEPGFYNFQTGLQRRSDLEGTNPCGEVLLRDRGVCNLSECNLTAYVNEDKSFNYSLFEDDLRLLTRIGSRITLVNMFHPEWDRVQKEDRLLGVSLTGICDAWLKLGAEFDLQLQQEILTFARRVSHDEAYRYHKFLGISQPKLITTVKPSGSLSQLPTVSSGCHQPYAPFYFRNIRMSALDPVARVSRDLGVTVAPQGGGLLEGSDTWVFTLPVRTHARFKSVDEPAIDQLSRYKMLMRCYVDHNVSVTISVGPDEWDSVANWLDENWDDFVGVSFLPRFDSSTGEDGSYPQMPYVTASEEQYNQMLPSVPHLTENEFLERLSEYEISHTEHLLEDSCSTGACPVR